MSETIKITLHDESKDYFERYAEQKGFNSAAALAKVALYRYVSQYKVNGLIPPWEDASAGTPSASGGDFNNNKEGEK